MTDKFIDGDYVRCSRALRLQGKAFPRTCPVCQIGPCRFYETVQKATAPDAGVVVPKMPPGTTPVTPFTDGMRAGLRLAMDIAVKHRAGLGDHDPEEEHPADEVAHGYGNAAFNIFHELRYLHENVSAAIAKVEGR